MLACPNEIEMSDTSIFPNNASVSRPLGDLNIHIIRIQRILILIIHSPSKGNYNRHIQLSICRPRRDNIHSESLLFHEVEETQTSVGIGGSIYR